LIADSGLEQKKMNVPWIKVAGANGRQLTFDFIEKCLENSTQAIGEISGWLIRRLGGPL
jgi:folylpolyglutamate synthase/dihydropteroate synthase